MEASHCAHLVPNPLGMLLCLQDGVIIHVDVILAAACGGRGAAPPDVAVLLQRALTAVIRERQVSAGR